MQVIVSHTFCPTIGDRSAWAVPELGAALKSRAHKIEDMLLPFDPGYSALEQILAFRLFEPLEYGDLMLTLHPPCHTTCHRGKVIWAIDGVMRNEELMRPGYFTADPASQTELESIRVSDRLGFTEARRICLRSKRACAAFSAAEEIPACFQPLPPRILYSGRPEEPVVAARGDAVAMPMLLIAIEALGLLSPSVRLLLFGSNPLGADQWNALLSLHGLHGRVEWRPAAEWPSILPSALAVLDLSSSADEAGRSAIDAHGCERPILFFDSPVSAEWVQDGENGLRLPLDPLPLASALTSLASDPGRSHALGLLGKSRLEEWGATWDHVVNTVTEL